MKEHPMNFYRMNAIVCAGIMMCMIPLAYPSMAFGQATAAKGINIQDAFIYTGWMGDGEDFDRFIISFSAFNVENCHSSPTCIAISYVFGSQKWAGIYWQNKPNNWGDEPGNDYSGRGFKKITFWARGQTGNEVVEFKAGGINEAGKKYRDSFSATIGRQKLTTEWKKYEIDLSQADLRSVIGGFCWIALAEYNSAKEITFYLDDIYFE
jgi:hypothetical protein